MPRPLAGSSPAIGTSALRVATVVLGDGTDADDVVQTASERAWRAISSVDPDVASGRGSCASSPTRPATSGGRGGGVGGPSCVWPPGRPRTIADPVDDTVTASERDVVVAALNRLEAQERLVIALRHFEQLSEQEMADVLDCPPGTVKSRLSRAMSRLRAELSMEAFGDA